MSNYFERKRVEWTHCMVPEVSHAASLIKLEQLRALPPTPEVQASIAALEQSNRMLPARAQELDVPTSTVFGCHAKTYWPFYALSTAAIVGVGVGVWQWWKRR